MTSGGSCDVPRRKIDGEHSPKKLKDAYDQCGGNITLMSKALGVSRPSVYEWLRKDGVIKDNGTKADAKSRRNGKTMRSNKRPSKKTIEVDKIEFLNIADYVKDKVDSQSEKFGVTEGVLRRWLNNCSPWGNEKQYRAAKDTFDFTLEYLRSKKIKLVKVVDRK